MLMKQNKKNILKKNEENGANQENKVIEIIDIINKKIIILMITLSKRKKKKQRDSDMFEEIGDFFDNVAAFFSFIWSKGICKFFRQIGKIVIFIIQMFKNNCPAIEWED